MCARKTKLPGNWMDFLRDSVNKKELFAFLTSKVAQFTWPPAKAVYVTSGQAVVCIGDSIPMQNCNHEEADTRIVVHVLHALKQGEQTICVRIVDTDVVVILAGTFHDLVATQPLADIWVAFGMGKNCRFYHINAICESLREPQSRALPVFHAFSGCDTTSAFNGKGKKSVWQAWQAFEDVTETFVYLAGHPFQLLDAEDGNFLKIERMTVILYDKTSPLSSVNETRRELFCHKNRAMDKLPPTKDALLQHTRRAVYQAGVWTMSSQTHLVVPSPQDFAWTKVSESWVPVSLSLCSDGSMLSCCDVDDSAPQIPPLCHSGCFTNVCPRPFLYVFLPGSCRSPSASLPCSDALDDGLFQAVVSDDVTKMFHLPFPHLFH